MWVLQLEAGREPVRLEGNSGFVEWLEFSPDGDRIAGTCEVEVGVGRHRSSLRIWDRATGKVLHEMPGSFNCLQLLARWPDACGGKSRRRGRL